MDVQPRIDSEDLSRNFTSMLERDKYLGRDDRHDGIAPSSTGALYTCTLLC